MNPCGQANRLRYTWNAALATSLLFRGRLAQIIAMLLCLLARPGASQEIVLEQAESDFLPSVEGAVGFSLDGYAGPLVAADASEASAFNAAAVREAAPLSLLSGRVVSLQPTTPTRPALIISFDTEGMLITWPA